MSTKKTTTKKATTSKATVKKAEVAEPVVEAKVETVKTEPVAEVKVAEPVVEEASAKKAPAKKTPAKKTTTKKATAKKAVEPVVDFFVEFNGHKEPCATIIENVKKSFLAENEGVEITSIKVYVKPQENAAYCVVNETSEFRMDVYF